MTQREQFITALEQRPLQRLVSHFELVFYLTMEAFSKVHPCHKEYGQWFQMSVDISVNCNAAMSKLY